MKNEHMNTEFSKDRKARHWCFTSYLNELETDEDDARYLIYGREVCPKTGRKHLQGYVELNKPMRMSAAQKVIGDKVCHMGIRYGTRDQAREYCMKDKNFFEIGKWISGQGHRSDLDDIVDQMKEGKRLTEIIYDDTKTYCQYRNGLRDVQAIVDKKTAKKFREVEVIVLSGPTGCGKTRQAMEEATYKTEGWQLKWWDGYDGDKVICIDEYNNDENITKLLNLLDGYTLRLDVKGTSTYALWNKVYITTNLRREQFHPNCKPAHKAALNRRIKWVDLWEVRDEEVQE